MSSRSTWDRTVKVTYVLAFGRVTLRVVQTRGNGPASQWWVVLEGVGQDPATGKPPATEIRSDLGEAEVLAHASAWALPRLAIFAKEQKRLADALVEWISEQEIR